MTGAAQYVLSLIAALGGGGAVTYLLTLRQRRNLLDRQAQVQGAQADMLRAQADAAGSDARTKATDVQAQAFERIINAAGNGLEHQTALVPLLLERITKLEGRAEARDIREEAHKVAMEEMRDRLEAAESHSTSVDQWIAELRRWATDHRSWDEQAVASIEALGGHIDPPPQIPDRRHPPVNGTPLASGLQPATTPTT